MAAQAGAEKPRGAPEQDGILLESDLKYTAGQTSLETRSKAIIDINSNDWIEVSRAKGRHILFARRIGGDAEVVELEFKLVDRNVAPEKVIAKLSVHTRMGQQAEVSSRTDGADSCALSVTATRVRFQIDQ